MEILWDYRVVLDLFLGGVGIGAFLFATLLFFIDAQKFESAIKKSWIISPILISAGLLLLLTELGRPLNVFKALFNTNASSVMSLGMFLQGACVALMLLIVLKIISSKVNTVSKSLVYISALFAVLVGMYHGFLLTGIERAAWTDAIPLVFFTSSLLAGASLALVLSVNDKEFEELNSRLKLPMSLTIVVVLQIISVFSWVYSLAIRSLDTKVAYEALMASFGAEFWLFVLVGLVAPLALFVIMLIKKVQSKAMFTTATLSLLAGSLIIKHIVVYLGQTV